MPSNCNYKVVTRSMQVSFREGGAEGEKRGKEGKKKVLGQ